jgi:hypothetical protein
LSDSSSSSSTTENIQQPTAIALEGTQAAREQEVPKPEVEEEETEYDKEFKKLREKYDEVYTKKIIEMSKKDTFQISLKKPTGNQIPDPLEEGKMMNEYKGWEEKKTTYKFQKVSAQDYHRIIKLEAKFVNEKNINNVVDNQARKYQFLAYCLIGMSYEDFERTDWNEIKLVCDACYHRVIYNFDVEAK